MSIDQLNRHQNVRPNGGAGKKSTRAKPVLAVAVAADFYAPVERFLLPAAATSRERTATANLILITRQPRRSAIAAGGIGVTLLPLECRSGSLRADSYLCAAPEARETVDRRNGRGEERKEGRGG